MKYEKIEDIDSLKSSCLKNWNNYIVLLNHGLISRKEIKFGGKKFHIIHATDGSTDVMSPDQLEADPVIGKAIALGNFFIEIREELSANH